MNNNFFDRQNLTSVNFVANHEEFVSEKKFKNYFSTKEACDGYFETLKGRIMEIENSNKPKIDDLLLDLPECKLVFRSHNILGEYYPGHSYIKYYKQSPETIEIVKIHERFHAIHHLMPDNQGAIWDEFPKIDSFYLELLAQLFTYVYIRDFEGSLLADFEELNKSQPFIYKTFKIFSHYDQVQAVNLYWAIRTKSQPTYKALIQIFSWMGSNPNLKIVPSTELRHYYKSFSHLSTSTETQYNALMDHLRGKNFNNLIKLYSESFEHVNKIYDNPNEPIFDKNSKTRKKSSGIYPPLAIESDEDVISVLQNRNPLIVVSDPIYEFEYIEREVSPLRTTGAKQENGKSAQRSGTGGTDFIGWNLKNDIPILGEIKVNNDQNPFYALIQLLTYLSEISTPNQIDRINKYAHFNKFLPENSQFYLYIFSCRTKKPLGKYDRILPGTKTLASRLVMGIPQIKDIVFLYMDPITRTISLE